MPDKLWHLGKSSQLQQLSTFLLAAKMEAGPQQGSANQYWARRPAAPLLQSSSNIVCPSQKLPKILRIGPLGNWIK